MFVHVREESRDLSACVDYKAYWSCFAINIYMKWKYMIMTLASSAKLIIIYMIPKHGHSLSVTSHVVQLKVY